MPRLKRPDASLGRSRRSTRAANADEIEVGRLQQDVLRRRRHLGLGPAHDSGQRDRPGTVGDDQHVRRQVALDAVEGLQCLFRPGRADDDGRRLAAGAGLQFVVVEGVQRLAPFQHDVVGHVDDVVDGPHAGIGEPPLHPARRRADGDVLEQGRRIARRQVRVGDLDTNLAGDRLACSLGDGRRQGQGLAGESGDLAGHADDRQAPGHVRRDLDLEDDVAEIIDERFPDRRVVIENDDAFMFLVDAKLERRADHGVAGDAAQLRRLQLLELLGRVMAIEVREAASGRR